MPRLTIFSAPKPFTDPHIDTIQRNAICSWLQLGAEVEVILIGEEAGLAEAAAQLGVRHLPQVQRNAQGTPLVSSIFDLAREHSSSPLLAYVNADILLFPDFVEAARQVAQGQKQFLVVGQRWDLDVRDPLDFLPGWQQRLASDVDRRGRLHPPGGSDYFIYPRSCFQHMPLFAVGRAGWDNWMIYHAREQGWAVVDATAAVRIVHQDHDYSHLPGGVAHYRLPETDENVRLAGGKRTIFGLADANQRLAGGRLRPHLTWTKFWREVEIFPLVKLHSMLLGQVFFGIFHPKKAYAQFRCWMKKF
ncbi:MAG: hypothetical protein PHQ40_05155 [Anaerolineaceae bacterium]|nr:hypothetical protein [Anaerolineaceae bacterium]